ncbi:MAG: hydrolase [Clostridiales bacterium]|nr:hydrolase [Clostridiales bacterium]
MDLEEIKQEFLEIFYDNIEREGSEELLNYLEKTDFFTAPASTKRHNSFAGGLCLHSINVYHRYIKLLRQEFGEDWQKVISLESATIISLLHDICKVNNYVEEMRNVKVNGEWIQKPYYKYSDPLPYGHGEKSVYMISGFMRLSREEAMAINWHMGGFDPRTQSSYALSDAFYKFPTAFLFHLADFMATYLDEKPSED